MPMKVSINERHHDVQDLGNVSSERETIARGQNASLQSSQVINSKNLNNKDNGRIQLNSVDITMMKNSFKDGSSRQIDSGGNDRNIRDHKNSLGLIN